MTRNDVFRPGVKRSARLGARAPPAVLFAALIAGGSAYCNGPFAQHQVVDQATCQHQCQRMVERGQEDARTDTDAAQLPGCYINCLTVAAGASYCQIDATGCVTDGSGSYGNGESCTIRVDAAGTLSATQFSTESGYDVVTIDRAYSGTTGPADVPVAAGSNFTWRSDGSRTNTGWTICLLVPSTTTTTTTTITTTTTTATATSNDGSSTAPTPWTSSPNCSLTAVLPEDDPESWMLPCTSEYVDRATGKAIGRWFDETSPGENGGPVWSSKCTCGKPGVVYCWEIGTAGWVLMSIPIILAVVAIFGGISKMCEGRDPAVVLFVLLVLAIGLPAGISSQDAPNGGPGAGEPGSDDDDGGQKKPSTVQNLVLGLSAPILLLIQYCAREYTHRAVQLPLAVESIVYLGMLDFITDVTYLSTKAWATLGLETAATVFVVAPFFTTGIFFMFKSYRLRYALGDDSKLGCLLMTLLEADNMMAVRVARALGLEAMAFMVVFPVITALERGKKRWSAATEFGTKTYGSSIIFVLVTCVMYILVVMATLAHVLFGVVCVLLAPAVYSFMAVLRTFAIFPGAWGFFEDTLKNWGMEDKAREAVGFKNQPSTNDSVDSVYYLLAATLMCEFVLETVPQITIQSINNDLMDDWDGFSVASVVISAFVTVDVLYRWLIMIWVNKAAFGSKEMFDDPMGGKNKVAAFKGAPGVAGGVLGAVKNIITG